MIEIKRWAILIICFICTIILVAFAIVTLPLSIITKLAKLLIEKSRDAIERIAEKYKD